MAACSELEEKPSSPKEPVHLKIYVENAGSHEMRKNCYNDLNSNNKNNESSPETTTRDTTTIDLKDLPDRDFEKILVEAATFNKPLQDESEILKQLRKEVDVTEANSSNVRYVDTECPSKYSDKANSTTYVLQDGSDEGSSILLNSQRTRKQRHNKNEPKPSIYLNALDKNPNRSQSLKDLSSDSTKSKKSFRTLSLSSEEAIAFISDSPLMLKTAKNSFKQSSNCSKSEQNKTIKGSCKVPLTQDSLITLDISDVNSEGFHSNASCESLPYQLLVNETDSLSSSRKNSNSETDAIDCPLEIEMEEIKLDKQSKDDKTLYFNKGLKTKNDPQQSNSTFYVDCSNDVDERVSYPLQPIDGQNKGDLIKKQVFPEMPWRSPVPSPVPSLFGISLTDSYGFKNDKDMNGNIFPRRIVDPRTTFSLVDNFNNSNFISEPKNRVKKRIKNNSDKKIVYSESIAGYRGKDDIDTLLEFINSSDKNKKPGVKSSPNQLLSNKNSMFHDHDKKKSLKKDIINCQKNLMGSEKKKLTRSNSLENIPHTEKDKSQTYSYEAGDTPVKSSKGASSLDVSVAKKLDINSNVENQLEWKDSNDSSHADESDPHILDHTPRKVSSFAADFYATANVSSQTAEESGFHVVASKKQKKKQSKRSDTYRRYTQNPRQKGMMLPLAESKCGKQDSRRKSTSSVPHSEHSSPDNSDVDSVCSLPARGSAPHATRPHPHTTPSSSSSTPQASYADIARMPTTKLNSPAPCIISYGGQTSPKQQSGEMEKKYEGSSVPHAKRKMSDSKESSTLIGKGISPVVELDKDRDICNESDFKVFCNESDIKALTQAKSTREINTQTEPQASVTENQLSVPSKTEHELTCEKCFLIKSECSCFKSQRSVRNKAKSVDLPPVIMDNIPPETNPCNVSFGFGIEEVLMAQSRCISSCSMKVNHGDSSSVEKSDYRNFETTDKQPKPIALNKVFTSSSDSLTKCSVSADIPKSVLSHDFSHEQSSQLTKVTIRSGKVLHFKDIPVSVNSRNMQELRNFVVNAFNATIREAEDSKKKGDSKVVYYSQHLFQ